MKNISATAENDCRTYFHHIRCQNPRHSIASSRGATRLTLRPETSVP